jgi:parallel beta-helix repeat protein
VGETYTLTGDITESIVIEKDSIVVDGAGYTVHGVGDVGLDLSHRNNVTVRNFRVVGFLIGVSLNSSDNNSIRFNTVRNNTYAGIQLSSSDHNKVMNNIALNNKYGIRVVNSSDCDFCWNNVTKNAPVGVFLNSPSSAISNFVLLENEFSNNNVGLWLWNSSGNTVYHNNFLNNSIQVSLHNSYNNNWDNGFEGNYWSDYHGSDADNNAIGDEAYSINENNQDKHPLMTRITKVKIVKPLPFWFEWWFWGICALAVTTVVLFGKYALQRKIIETYRRQLEIFPEVSHLDRARMLFKADVDRRRGKIEEFGKKYGVRIRRVEDSFEDALERLGIERNTPCHDRKGLGSREHRIAVRRDLDMLVEGRHVAEARITVALGDVERSRGRADRRVH